MKKEIKPWKCSEFVYIETAAIYKSAFFALFSWYMAMLLVCVCVCRIGEDTTNQLFLANCADFVNIIVQRDVVMQMVAGALENLDVLLAGCETPCCSWPRLQHQQTQEKRNLAVSFIAFASCRLYRG